MFLFSWKHPFRHGLRWCMVDDNAFQHGHTPGPRRKAPPRTRRMPVTCGIRKMAGTRSQLWRRRRPKSISYEANAGANRRSIFPEHISGAYFNEKIIQTMWRGQFGKRAHARNNGLNWRTETLSKTNTICSYSGEICSCVKTTRASARCTTELHRYLENGASCSHLLIHWLIDSLSH